jgi:hypothetical protein
VDLDLNKARTIVHSDSDPGDLDQSSCCKTVQNSRKDKTPCHAGPVKRLCLPLYMMGIIPTNRLTVEAF